MSDLEDLALARRIAALIGEDRLVPIDARGLSPTEDVCRAAIGSPRAWVRPRSTDEVASLIRLARAESIPVVAAGHRTAYWRPLRFERAIVLETRALTAIEPHDRGHGSVWCGAGASVREVDDALRLDGHALAAYPDAFGGTSIGSMVATGFTSGIGMAIADANALVTGLEVVLGTGETVRTGAAASLGAPAFLRTGLPDPTGLLLAAEGALGVVTRVAVRSMPRAHRCQLRFLVSAPLGAMLPLADALRVPGLYETFRAVDPGEACEPGAQPAPLEVDLVVRSPLSEVELEGRVRWVCERIASLLPEATEPTQRRERPDQSVIPRFRGAAGEAWARTRKGRFAPVDVNLGYPSVLAAIAAGERLLAEHRDLPWINLRRALYFTPDFVNFGLHWSLDAARSDDASALRFIEAGAVALAGLPLIPYRFGRVWSAALGDRLDSGYHALMLELQRVCDPDGILNPGVSIFGVEAANDE